MHVLLLVLLLESRHKASNVPSRRSLRPMTHIPETGTENRYLNNGTGFRRVCHAIWYRIFPVPDSGNGSSMFYFVQKT